MPGYKSSDIRNVALLGHGGAGKTTLTDHTLKIAGAANRAGSVNDGSSLSDYDPEEKDRQFSIESTLFSFDYQGKRVNWIDAPGYPEFVAGPLGAIQAVETGVLCINAQAGIQLNTRKLWAAAEAAGIARVVCVTRMDADNIQYDMILGAIEENFGKKCVCVFVPIGLGSAFTGVANVLKTTSAPAGVLGDFGAARTALIDAIVETDEALMERYLDGQEIGADELSKALRTAFHSGAVVPVLFTSNTKEIGVRELLDFLCEFGPSPVDGRMVKATNEAGEPVELKADPDAPAVGQVFKIQSDQHVGKVSFIRVWQGTFEDGKNPVNVRTEKPERLGHLLSVFGSQQSGVDKAVAGDIFCVTKVESLALGDSLCDPKLKVNLEKVTYPKPMMSLAVEPKSRNDEQRISTGLARIAEGDATFSFGRDEQTNELIITGMSTLHLDVMLSKLKRRYDVEVVTHEPAIPYKETVTRQATASHRHKKQSGGHGEFAEVHLRVEPLERGAGFEFADEVTGGSIPRQFIPACEKGVRETLAKGVITGNPVVDVRCAVFFGKDHPVDSSEAAFKKAASRAFKAAFMEAKPVLLEPVVKIEVTIPSEFMGEITSHLTTHRGRIQGMDSIGNMQVVKAEIPLAEVTSYSTELKSMTQGQGSFSMEFSHLDIVPSHIQQQIVASAKKEAEEED